MVEFIHGAADVVWGHNVTNGTQIHKLEKSQEEGNPFYLPPKFLCAWPSNSAS